MYRFLDSLGWGSTKEEDENKFNWDELPFVVRLEILKYLDRRTLNHLREISRESRYLIEHVHGLHVILPARAYALPIFLRIIYPSLCQKSVTDSMFLHFLRQMEGKKITKLDMMEMPPPSLAQFTFTKFINLPQFLQDVNLQYVDVSLVHSLLSQCPLITFQYQSAHWRPLPSGPIAYAILHNSFAPGFIPATNTKLISEVDNLGPLSDTRLRLRDLTLTIYCMTYVFNSDWGNVIYILLALPSLPTLTKFKFSIHPLKPLVWKTHYLILSCLGEFFMKVPNLQEIGFDSTTGIIPATHSDVNPRWILVLCALIRKCGSDRLKEVGEAANGTAQEAHFELLTGQIWNAAASSLKHVRELEVKYSTPGEHRLLLGFSNHLSGPNVTTRLQRNY